MQQQAQLCFMLAERLLESVEAREIALLKNEFAKIGYGIPGSSGAGKTQLQADITRLRRELLILNEMVKEGVIKWNGSA